MKIIQRLFLYGWLTQIHFKNLPNVKIERYEAQSVAYSNFLVLTVDAALTSGWGLWGFFSVKKKNGLIFCCKNVSFASKSAKINIWINMYGTWHWWRKILPLSQPAVVHSLYQFSLRVQKLKLYRKSFTLLLHYVAQQIYDLCVGNACQ